MLDAIKANFRVPHPTLIAIGISVAISAITVGILYMADSNGMFGLEDAEAKKKTSPLRKP